MWVSAKNIGYIPRMPYEGKVQRAAVCGLVPRRCGDADLAFHSYLGVESILEGQETRVGWINGITR